MSLEFYDESTAERLFEHTFIKWIAYGYKGCYSPSETRRKIADARAWAWRSKTARDLMNAVVSSDQKIIVVGMRGGFQCFNSTEGPDADLPVVFVDLDGSLTTNVRDAHNLHWDPNECTSTVVPLPNNVALLHEFGHARQWIERPLMFDNATSKGATRPVHRKRDGAIVGQVKAGALDFDARLEKKTFASAIKSGARARWERPGADAAFLPDDGDAAGKPPVWGVVIEEDNMSRHEWPICRELGLPLRKNYRDINATSTGAPSPTSMIVIKARKFEADEAARLARVEQEKSALKTGEARCAQCGATFPGKMKLMQHAAAAKHAVD